MMNKPGAAERRGRWPLWGFRAYDPVAIARLEVRERRGCVSRSSGGERSELFETGGDARTSGVVRARGARRARARTRVKRLGKSGDLASGSIMRCPSVVMSAGAWARGRAARSVHRKPDSGAVVAVAK